MLTYCALEVNDDSKFSFIVEQGKNFGHFIDSLNMNYVLKDEYPKIQKSISTFQYLVTSANIKVTTIYLTIYFKMTKDSVGIII